MPIQSAFDLHNILLLRYLRQAIRPLLWTLSGSDKFCRFRGELVTDFGIHRPRAAITADGEQVPPERLEDPGPLGFHAYGVFSG